MSVSRDFIDSCSPEAPAPGHRIEQTRPLPLGPTDPSQRAVWRDNVSFRFPRQRGDVRNALISLPKTGRRCLNLCRAAPDQGALAAAALPPARTHAHLTSVLNFVFTRVVNH